MTEKDGAAMIREILVDRLREAGLKRPKGQTEKVFEEWVDRVVHRLAYMRRENVETLTDTCLTQAAATGGIWPTPVLIVQWAEALQPRPWSLAPIVTSWLASIEGPKADAGGYLVQLFRQLRERPLPPGPFDVTRMRERAQEDQRQVELIRDRIARGVVLPEQRKWLVDYLSDEQAARALVEDGERRRLEKQTAEQEGRAA